MGRNYKESIPAFLAFLLLLYICFGLPLRYPVPFAKEGETTDVIIAPGMSARDAARRIHAAGVVDSTSELINWMIRFEIDRTLKPGLYKLNSGKALDVAVQLKNMTPITESVMLIPGMRYLRIAEVLSVDGNLEEVAAALQNDKNFPEKIRDKLPKKARDRIAFLLPESYYITPGGNRGAQVISSSSKLWWEKVGKKLPEDISASDLLKLATLASVVEGEAKVAEERPILAGIFLSRIDKQMRLQSCATVIYCWELKGVKKNALTYRDLEIESPYNTYLNSGLPPGPISIPSLDSWASTVNPVETDYLFFFATPNGNHIFSKTYSEHLRRQREAVQ